MPKSWKNSLLAEACGARIPIADFDLLGSCKGTAARRYRAKIDQLFFGFEFERIELFMGFVEAADGRSDTARGFWNRLLDLLPPGSADRGVVERALKDLPD